MEPNQGSKGEVPDRSSMIAPCSVKQFNDFGKACRALNTGSAAEGRAVKVLSTQYIEARPWK